MLNACIEQCMAICFVTYLSMLNACIEQCMAICEANGSFEAEEFSKRHSYESASWSACVSEMAYSCAISIGDIPISRESLLRFTPLSFQLHLMNNLDLRTILINLLPLVHVPPHAVRQDIVYSIAHGFLVPDVLHTKLGLFACRCHVSIRKQTHTH